MGDDSKTPTKPHHIKISNTVKSNHGITIIKGKAPKKMQKQALATAPTNNTNVTKGAKIKTPAPPPSPDFISNRSCLNPKTTNRNKNIAESLRLYLKTKNQDASVIDDILNASQSIGVDFELMITKAMIESDLGRLTKNRKSSASGLFQYIDSTWLTLLKRYGNAIGEAQYAQALQENPKTLKTDIKKNSRFSRQELLDLRFNNRIAALIKAHQTKEDQAALKHIKNNGIITATDHYIAHMMGIPLAKEFYKTLKNESHIILANSNNSRFQMAARLNPAFFNDQNGTPLSAQNAYQQFHDKVSRRYDKIRNIHKKFGNTALSAHNCALPSIKTATLE